MPFIAVIRLIDKINEKSIKKGLDKNEFSIFVPTLINFDLIDEYVEKILEFRKEKNKDKYLINFIEEFYESKNISVKKINNLYDYGDNIIRYFRLTKYFKVSMYSTGYHWNINLEPSRKVEIQQLLDMYNGESFKFSNIDEYLSYISDIAKPTLPWEKKENLEKVAQSLKVIISDFIKKENVDINLNKKKILLTDIKKQNKRELEIYINQLRILNLKLKEMLNKKKLINDLKRIEEIIKILRDSKKLKKFQPEQF